MKARCGRMPGGEGYLGTNLVRLMSRPRSRLDRLRFNDERELSDAVSEASELCVDIAETIILAPTFKALRKCFLTLKVSSSSSSEELDKSSRLSSLSGRARSWRDGSLRFDADLEDCKEDDGMLLRIASSLPEPTFRRSPSATLRSFETTRYTLSFFRVLASWPFICLTHCQKPSDCVVPDNSKRCFDRSHFSINSSAILMNAQCRSCAVRKDGSDGRTICIQRHISVCNRT